MCGVLSLGCLLAGCATVGNIKNSSNELIYNGNAAVMVDGHLYYGNAFADITTFSSDSDYKKSAKLSYLARLNTSIDLAAENKNFCPENVETVSKKVSGYSNSFMFVLGNYVYYATPNREEIETEEGVSNQYGYTTLYRSKLNGDGLTKIYTTDGEVSQIEVLKHNSKYYIVIFANSKLTKIEIGKKVGKVETIADGVLSVAMPETYQKDDAGSSLDFNGYIYYTTARKVDGYDSASGTQFNKVLLTGDKGEGMKATTDSISFVGREKDIVFLSKDGQTYTVDVSNNNSKSVFTESSYSTKFYTSSITEIETAASENLTYGYLFKSSQTLMYKKTGEAAKKLVFNDKSGTEISSYKVVASDGMVKYIATTTSIYRADLTQVDQDGKVVCDTVVTMTGIHDGSVCAYDGKYIYFYAQLQAVDGEEAAITETDANYYLYRAKADVNPNAESQAEYELLSKTQTDLRHS